MTRRSPHHPSRPPGRSLSRRLVWLTVGVVLLVQVLFFVPSLGAARGEWLRERVARGQLAALSLTSGEPDRTTTEDLLQLAGADSVRLLLPGRGAVTLGPNGQVQASHVVDLRQESELDSLREAFAALLDGADQLVLVQSSGAVRPGTLVSVVVHSADLTRSLRAAAAAIFWLGLVVAAVTGTFVYLALRALLVRPLRQLTASIGSFRADPDRTPPPDTGDLMTVAADEVAVASRELAEMQRELRAALWRNARLAALGTAVAKVSHDLRGLLAPAMLASERLQNHTDPAVQKSGNILVRSVERATELVRGSLEFAREGPVTLSRGLFPLAPLVEEALEQCRAALPATVLVNRVEEALEIYADRTQVGRVLANLVRNAAENGAARCEVSATATQFEVTVTVSDDGPGLPERVRAALFKPFVIGGRKGSTGLGLAIARDLMRAHQGEASLLYTGAGGTAFQLTLPASLSSRP